MEHLVLCFCLSEKQPGAVRAVFLDAKYQRTLDVSARVTTELQRGSAKPTPSLELKTLIVPVISYQAVSVSSPETSLPEAQIAGKAARSYHTTGSQEANLKENYTY